MNLKQLVQHLQQEVEEFEIFWEEKSEEDPESYPTEFDTTEEWFEQFMTWMESRDS